MNSGKKRDQGYQINLTKTNRNTAITTRDTMMQSPKGNLNNKSSPKATQQSNIT